MKQTKQNSFRQLRSLNTPPQDRWHAIDIVLRLKKSKYPDRQSAEERAAEMGTSWRGVGISNGYWVFWANRKSLLAEKAHGLAKVVEYTVRADSRSAANLACLRANGTMFDGVSVRDGRRDSTRATYLFWTLTDRRLDSAECTSLPRKGEHRDSGSEVILDVVDALRGVSR